MDEIDKQPTTWAVNSVDSKPHYKTPIILTSAVHYAGVWALCSVQYAVGSMQCEVCGSPKLKSDYSPLPRKSKIEIWSMRSISSQLRGRSTLFDSKPHYKTPIILTTAVHYACMWALCSVQYTVGSMQCEVWGSLKSKSDYCSPQLRGQ